MKKKVEEHLKKEVDVVIPKNIKPKLKIIGVGKEEFELEDKQLIKAIKMQNEIETSEGNDMKVIKIQY